MHIGKDTYYDPEKRRTSWIRIAFIVAGIIIIAVIVFVLIKIFTKGPDLYTDLVSSTKRYSTLVDDFYPDATGSCNTVDLSSLKEKNSIANIDYYKKCNENDTYVKVCKVSDDVYQYTPVISCGKKNTEFGDWMSGTADNLKQSNSDVEFKFLPEQLQVGQKNYYPGDIIDASKLSMYYVNIPAEGYTYKDSSATAYKWYVEKQGKEYYNDGKKFSEAPDDYTNKSDESSITYASLATPSNESYRTFKDSKIYATETVAHPYKYECVDSKIGGTVTSNTVCEQRNSSTFKTTKKIYYTCDGTNTVNENTECGSRSEWTLKSCTDTKQTNTGTTNDGYSYTRQITTGITCISTNGYSVTDKVWKWYKTATIKSYYPSNSTSADDENTYYANTPTAGASKDEETQTTAYKYYKLDTTKTDITSWVSITDNSLTVDEMINKFKELGYDVTSLKDIENNTEIRYQLEITYRNRK